MLIHFIIFNLFNFISSGIHKELVVFLSFPLLVEVIAELYGLVFLKVNCSLSIDGMDGILHLVR